MTQLPSLKELIIKYDLMPQKKLGQNFILDSNVTDKIVSFAGSLADKTVIEVGPGPGGLTRSILNAGANKVFAIELDFRCLEALTELETFYYPRLNVISGDALKIDISTIADAPKGIIANLPYNVATELLIGWLQRIDQLDFMILMFQREVANRIVSLDNSDGYGRLGVMCNWLCHTEKVYDLPPEVFMPAPKVHSAVVKFTPRNDISEKLPYWLSMELVTKVAFNQRRKMLRSSLKSLFKDETVEILQAHNIDSTMRAENLTIDQFFALAKFVFGYK